jgi:glycosyltransferase involved in cell wall biosynthesis
MSVYCKEQPKFLLLSLESITAQQTLKPTQIVLVKDGLLSVELDNVISLYKEKYQNIFTVVSLPKNVGLGIALNEGLKHCHYDLVARMDSDDIALPNRFDKQIKFFINNTECDILGGFQKEFISEIDDNSPIKKIPTTHGNIVSFMRKRNPMNHPTVMFRKSVVERIGGYKHFYLLEDYYLWYRMQKGGATFANLPEILVYGRVGNDMVGRRRGWKYFKSEQAFLAELLQDSFISEITYFWLLVQKFILRNIPKFLLNQVYKTFLR